MSKTSKLNLFNFGTQGIPAPAAEPIPAAPVEAAPAQAAETMTRGQKYAPMSVYVSARQREIISQIANMTGQTKHAVLQYAIRKVCSDWEQGIYPEMEMKPRFK